LSIALETTTPRRSWRRPRSPSGFGRRVMGFRSPVAAALRFFGGRVRRSDRGTWRRERWCRLGDVGRDAYRRHA